MAFLAHRGGVARALASALGLILMVSCGSEPSSPQAAPLLLGQLPVLQPSVAVATLPITLKKGDFGLSDVRETIWPSILLRVPPGKKVERAQALLGDIDFLASRRIDDELWKSGKLLNFQENSKDVRDFLASFYGPDQLLDLGYSDGLPMAISFDVQYFRQGSRYWLLRFSDGSHALLKPLELTLPENFRNDIFILSRTTRAPDFLEAYLRSQHRDLFEAFDISSRSREPQDIDRAREIEKELARFRVDILLDAPALNRAKAWFDMVFVPSRKAYLQANINAHTLKTAEIKAMLDENDARIADLEDRIAEAFGQVVKQNRAQDTTEELGRRLRLLKALRSSHNRQRLEYEDQKKRDTLELQGSFQWKPQVLAPAVP